jgi:hypothetical protein
MRMFLTLAVLLTAAPPHSDPELNRQLDRWRTLNEQCGSSESYNCKKKIKENCQLCEATTIACWERLALDKILISKGCEYQTRECPLPGMSARPVDLQVSQSPSPWDQQQLPLKISGDGLPFVEGFAQRNASPLGPYGKSQKVKGETKD